MPGLRDDYGQSFLGSMSRLHAHSILAGVYNAKMIQSALPFLHTRLPFPQPCVLQESLPQGPDCPGKAPGSAVEGVRGLREEQQQCPTGYKRSR